MIWCDNNKNDLNIEHRFISIGGHENHDKGNNTVIIFIVW